ncbi:MAG TPA: heavy metal translocating P-type ATPase [Jatrophihabitans sp.]|nr:heavy metal translocating P-type ATPase [Jatrophihabitans sp.]
MPDTDTDLATPTEYAIGGMTCASCAARIEKKLNRLPGVQASVNYATATAVVSGTGTDQVIQTVEKIGYTAAPSQPGRPQREETDELRQRLLISLALTIPLALLAMIPALQFTGWRWVALALATPVATWGAWPFHRTALRQARQAASSMDTLVSIGVSASYLWSWWAVLTNGRDLYLEVAGVVTVLILLGRFLEARARRRSGQALRSLLDLGAKQVAVIRDGQETLVPIEQLLVGDSFVVRPGEKIATDGVIVEGTATLDTSAVTGESVPAEVAPGDQVVGATVNLSGRLLVRALAVGADTQLAQIARLVAEAQNGKARVQRLADRVSAIFVPIVLSLAVLTLLGWLVTGHTADAAFTAAVAVLIIACPCALGLATPTALLVGTGRGAQLGILIRGPQVLEQAAKISTIVLDKTGTVTTGQMRLSGITPADGWTDTELHRLAAAVEHASAHPIAAAISHAWPGELPPVTGFADSGGLGVTGTVDGHRIRVGRRGWLGLDAPMGLARQAEQDEQHGRTPVWVAVDDTVAGLLTVSDTVRDTSAEAIRRLRGLGLGTVLLTGDNLRAAGAVAEQVGIDTVIADVLPTDKAAVIERLQAEGRAVAMVGDGVNDAAALATAELGLAMGGGTDIAMQASDLTLVRPDLLLAADAIRLSRATLRTIEGNLVWAFGYNVAAIPLAALGLLNPIIAGGAMAFSSVFVVSNSLRLRRFR